MRLANWLRDNGFKRGDVIALVSDNNPQVFDVYWAAQRTGLYLTAVNYHLHANEIRYILENSGSKALFLGDTPTDLDSSWADLPGLLHRVSISSQKEGFESLNEIVRTSPNMLPESEPRGADMLYSSGTTGRPKGVRPPLPSREVSEPGDAMVAMFSGHFECDENTVYLSPAPLYHAAPLRTCASVQALGGTVVVMEKFEPQLALEAIQAYRANVSQWVPTMFVRMLKLDVATRDKYDISSMKVAIHAAAPCPVEVKRQMIAWWGPILYEYYSCTEVNGMTIIRPQDWLERPGSVGKAAIGIIHICDDSGRELTTGEDGMVYFERDVMPFEYHGDPEKTVSTQHPEHSNWTTVGDIGHVDDDGYLYLTDRKAFMIISGGVNIYPQEVESALALHPAIVDIAVIGVPDAEMGEAVKAVVSLSPIYEPSVELAQEIINFARSRVASYKAPRTVDFVDFLPRTPTGKLPKGEVRKLYWPAKS